MLHHMVYTQHHALIDAFAAYADYVYADGANATPERHADAAFLRHAYALLLLYWLELLACCRGRHCCRYAVDDTLMLYAAASSFPPSFHDSYQRFTRHD